MKDQGVNVEREALTAANERQEESPSGGRGGRDGPKLRRVRLKTLLRELVDQEGRMEAAEMLGVNYRTLVRAEKTGQFTGRMRDALHRLLEPRQAPEVSPIGRTGHRPGLAGEEVGNEFARNDVGRCSCECRCHTHGGRASVVREGCAAASGPGVGHRRPGRFRRRGLRPSVAPGGGVAATEAGPSQPGSHPVVADHGGAAADPRAGHYGTARAHPAAGDPAPPWLRTQGAVSLAVGGASRHA